MLSENPSERPIKPIRSDDVPWTAFDDVPNFNIRYKHLTLAAVGEGYHVGVAIEELPAGMRTAPAHYHFIEEEHVFILEGALTLRLGAETHRMQAGDYVCFPAGQKAGHTLINEGDRPCRYVIVGENSPNEVVVYTDTNKVLVRPLGRRALLDLAATRNYWDGEDTGLPAGERPPADAKVEAEDPDLSPKPPIASDSVAWEESLTAEKFGGRTRHLTYAAVGGDYHVGMAIESPAPGKRLFPRHYHMLEEEQAIVLEGEVTLLLTSAENGDERHVMKPGDYVCFPAGRKVAHSFLNSGSGPCRYLIIGERKPADVCVYPDSNKLAVPGLDERQHVFDKAATRRYWDGEA
ncbi:cupin domain-containing protein [Dongia sp.]|uniref:cupin domain-containing protein n=1 Tax=Dongia sp. TaxID=1977262 RepID=UPI0037511DD7